MVPLKYSTSKDCPARALLPNWCSFLGMERTKIPCKWKKKHFKWISLKKVQRFVQTTRPSNLNQPFLTEVLDDPNEKSQSSCLRFRPRWVSKKNGEVEWLFRKPGVKLNAGTVGSQKGDKAIHVICYENQKHPPQLKQHGGNELVNFLHSNKLTRNSKMAGVSSNVLSKGGIFWGCTAWTWAVSKQGDHDFRVVMRWPADNRNSTAVFV